ncbi:MAG: metallophosphoesterase [Bacteroidota bacterium]|nr:metallophosphoesterase [Bacteroidota bacterium]
MRILAFTDIHSSYKRVFEIINSEKSDLVIIGGDLTNVGTVQEVESVIRQLQTLTPNLLCVAGNMDLPQHDDLFCKLNVSIHGKGLIINELGIFGVSGSPVSPLRTPYEIDEEVIAEKIAEGYQDVLKAKIKILVSHAPPYGTKVDIVHSGFHAGSSAVRDFIENEKVDVVICGHIHEARGQDVLGKTKIINCGQASRGYYGVIQISEKIEVTNSEYR